MKHIYQTIFILASFLISTVAFAHGNLEVHTAHSHAFTSGLLHPFSGMDHLLTLLLAAILLHQSRLPMIKSVTALMVLIAMGSACGLLFGEQAWVEAGIILSLAAMFMLLWIKPVHIQSLILAVCSLAIITQGWTHGSFISASAFSTPHEIQFISGVVTSSLLLLYSFAAGAFLMTRMRKA